MNMSEFIEKELAIVKQNYSSIPGAELIACVTAIVQIKITKTNHKSVVVRFQFPEDYPKKPILIELVSKVMSYKLLDGLSHICENEAKKLLGQRQIIPLAIFIQKFIEDNPLCVCSDEISKIKRKVLGPDDEIKLKQKTSQVVVKFKEDGYFCSARLTIPDRYPLEKTKVEIEETNMPNILKTNVLHQAIEIARQCVHPPLRKNPKDPPFQPKPALQPIIEHIASVMRKWPAELCPCCGKKSLPNDPKDVTNEESLDRFVERMYCLHLFHHGCLEKYMKLPPFTGGKKCPSCGKRIYHEKWKVTPELAEARWAHKEARQRELNEVVDFLE